jgi:hypothetical protein
LTLRTVYAIVGAVNKFNNEGVEQVDHRLIEFFTELAILALIAFLVGAVAALIWFLTPLALG